VAIATRIVGDGPQTAPQAFVYMAAQSCCATTLNGVQRFQMLAVEAAQAALDEGRSSGADYIGHL
jgi:hypothetical protein